MRVQEGIQAYYHRTEHSDSQFSERAVPEGTTRYQRSFSDQRHTFSEDKFVDIREHMGGMLAGIRLVENTDGSHGKVPSSSAIDRSSFLDHIPTIPNAPQLAEVELDDPTPLAIHSDEDRYSYQDIDGQLFVDGVSMDDVNQGSVGDCYLMASLASIAKTDPSYIENMITDNGNGTYTVHFYSNESRGLPIHLVRGLGDVTVDDDFLVSASGNPMYAKTGDRNNPELWVAVIEKAYAQAKGGYENIVSGRSEKAYDELTGQRDFTVRKPSQLSPAELEDALAEGRSVTASSYYSPRDEDTGLVKKPINDVGIRSSHAYVVNDVFERDGETYVQVYNPWGFDGTGAQASDENTRDGLITLTWGEFSESFRTVEIKQSALSRQ